MTGKHRPISLEMSAEMYVNFNCRAQKGDNMNAMTNQMRKCTQMVNEVIMDQSAYIRACVEKKQLDLDKYKDQIRQEMKLKEKKKKPKCSEKGNLVFHDKHFCQI